MADIGVEKVPKLDLEESHHGDLELEPPQHEEVIEDVVEELEPMETMMDDDEDVNVQG